MTRFLLAAVAAVGIALSGCERPRAAGPPMPVAAHALASVTADPKPIDDHDLHNLVDTGVGIYNGAMPETDAAFARLRAMGIRTIVSVDGAPPDVERAKKFGMRYIHLPIFYSGVPDEQNLLISKAFRDLPKPIYIHCHHGQHRSPAATAVALVSIGKMDNPSARRFLELCGTSTSYAGLYRDVERAAPISCERLDAIADDWPERAAGGDTVQAMTEIDQAMERMESIQAASWSAPANHPDLVPHAEAALIAEHFRELARLPESRARSEDYNARLQTSEDAAGRLRDQFALARPDPEKLRTCFESLKASCRSCHKLYRDN